MNHKHTHWVLYVTIGAICVAITTGCSRYSKELNDAQKALAENRLSDAKIVLKNIPRDSSVWHNKGQPLLNEIIEKQQENRRIMTEQTRKAMQFSDSGSSMVVRGQRIRLGDREVDVFKVLARNDVVAQDTRQEEPYSESQVVTTYYRVDGNMFYIAFRRNFLYGPYTVREMGAGSECPGHYAGCTLEDEVKPIN